MSIAREAGRFFVGGSLIMETPFTEVFFLSQSCPSSINVLSVCDNSIKRTIDLYIKRLFVMMRK
jgi:hypothetical protein